MTFPFIVWFQIISIFIPFVLIILDIEGANLIGFVTEQQLKYLFSVFVNSFYLSPIPLFFISDIGIHITIMLFLFPGAMETMPYKCMVKENL